MVVVAIVLGRLEPLAEVGYRGTTVKLLRLRAAPSILAGRLPTALRPGRVKYNVVCLKRNAIKLMLSINRKKKQEHTLKSAEKILWLLSLQALSSSRLVNVTVSQLKGSEVVAEELSEYTEFKDDAL